jgi:putative ABC transport system permease protein
VKYIPLIWLGIWRKPGRTTLILVQVALAFALFGVLQGMKTGVDHAIADARADVLFVGNAAFGGAAMPYAYGERLKKIPGIKTVTFADGIPASYQKPTEGVFVLAIERSDAWLTLVPEIFSVTPKDLAALHNTRNGVLISADIARKYGWKIGDRIPLTSPILQGNGSGTWIFEAVGFFTAHELGSGGYIVMNYDYLDEARAMNKGTVRNFYAVADDPKQAQALSEKIDAMFANSPVETRTASFKENAQLQMKQIGDLNFAIRSILSAVLVALLFSTSTMMMQNIRERTPELAVLKSLGFTDRAVFLMVLAEALVTCVLAALIGLALAWGVFPYAAKFVAGLTMPVIVIASGVLGAVLVALISAAVPAFRAARLQVVDALAGR